MEILIAILVVTIVMGLIAQVGARTQPQVATSDSPSDVLVSVDSRFSAVWKKQRSGDGDLNYKPLFALFSLPTLSVGVRPTGAGGSEVLIWVSDYHTRGPFMVHAPTMWIKKMMLARHLGSDRP